MLALNSFRTAAMTLADVELAHRICEGPSIRSEACIHLRIV
jgi:hypothetical protein